ncbi:NADH dehydrogenase (quinone), G subunit [Gleimia coleocanis DSM 15436]|uniref:NADH dehydrogenase (Quinone), G subunit n=1 Tax=Gleimia coleocanis DSM 15436 TaxID=525245 RepID=C0VYX3_9ACTO|nr:NADH-quinone oxidoreductase subunit G [Gleimia coleocanis]EEH64626.1 NADH dehydrogenase (quinone), G subunit [Gleimia coleocanis DSM 15436]
MSAPNMVNLTIDGTPVSVPQGTLIIRAAEKIGIRIPRFCDHPLLKPAGACRQCLVEVAMPDREGVVRPMPKPQTSCTMTVMEGMEVKTQRTSEVAEKAQKGIMEFLLINHPLDCPICDKGGECPLQNQAMSDGREKSRFIDAKRSFAKPIKLSTQIMLDRERCILCQRCVRFSKQIAGDAFIDLQGRGAGTAPTDHHYFMGEQIGTFDTQVLGFYNPELNPTGHDLTPADEYAGPYGKPGVAGSLTAGPTGDAELDETGRPFASYFSGNTIQICPVGALTAASYRFRGRPFDLVSTPSVSEHDASGSAIRVDIRRGEVVRRLAGEDGQVNEEWITDKDRFAYQWSTTENRLNKPLVRKDGELVETSWSEALQVAAAGLRKAQETRRSVLLPGGRLTVEDAYAWSKFARVALGTNQIDQRVRYTSGEESQFLGCFVAGKGLDVTYSDLETAGRVLMVGLEAEDEIGSVFLRLRKGVLAGAVKVTVLAPFTSNSTKKLSAQLLQATPGTEVSVLNNLDSALVEELANGIILVGERAGETPGLYTAVASLAQRTGARLAWIPRRAGERGGLDAGLNPVLLPFGRPVADAVARAEVEAIWGVKVPEAHAHCTRNIVAKAATESYDAIITGGIDTRDFPSSAELTEALHKAEFVVALEVNRTAVTELADVVLPVAPVAEKNGTFINWEGRLRPFGQALASRALTDRDVLNRLALELGYEMGLETLKATHAEINQLMGYRGARLQQPAVDASTAVEVGAGQAILATHKPMLDAGLLQAGATELAGTARKPVARLSAETAGTLGISEGAILNVSTDKGTITLPLVIADLPASVVWVPECSTGSFVHDTLGAKNGSVVTIAANAEVTR